MRSGRESSPNRHPDSTEKLQLVSDVDSALLGVTWRLTGLGRSFQGDVFPTAYTDHLDQQFGQDDCDVREWCRKSCIVGTPAAGLGGLHWSISHRPNHTLCSSDTRCWPGGLHYSVSQRPNHALCSSVPLTPGHQRVVRFGRLKPKCCMPEDWYPPHCDYAKLLSQLVTCLGIVIVAGWQHSVTDIRYHQFHQITA